MEEGFLVPNERVESPISFSTCWQPYFLHVKLAKQPEVVCIKKGKNSKRKEIYGVGVTKSTIKSTDGNQ